jgi:uncharacterized damage-inducible protein DinB
MSAPPQPEAWLRGPLDGVPPLLMPVAHALVQASEDLERVASSLSGDELWTTPGGAASVGFHLRHVAGSLDRLFTYARGEVLSPSQRAALVAEKPSTEVRPDARELLDALRRAMDAALDQLRRTSEASLTESRGVGRGQTPSTVIGLLFHAAEHAQRHTGQAIATAKAARQAP